MVCFLSNPIKSFIIHRILCSMVFTWILTQNCWCQEIIYLCYGLGCFHLKKKKKVTLTLPAAAADNCPMRRETHPPAAMSAYQPMQKTLTTSHSLCQVASNKGTTHSAMGLFDFFTWSKTTLPILLKTKKDNSDSNDIYFLSW